MNMPTNITIEEVLQKAIQKEIESQNLYSDLSQKMTDIAVKDVLQGLVRQEQAHQQLLERYLRGELKEGALSAGETIDYKIAEHFNQPEISPDMQLKDVFLLAANREKASHELYLSLSQIHPAGSARRMFEELASQELEHKQKVEFLYTEVAFPQTAGG
jgi:rubrerythrin